MIYYNIIIEPYRITQCMVMIIILCRILFAHNQLKTLKTDNEFCSHVYTAAQY